MAIRKLREEEEERKRKSGGRGLDVEGGFGGQEGLHDK
jgi:hypothetical protein